MAKSILTKREKQVFELLILNNTTAEIAEKLGITMTGLIKIAVNDYIKKN